MSNGLYNAPAKNINQQRFSSTIIHDKIQYKIHYNPRYSAIKVPYNAL